MITLVAATSASQHFARDSSRRHTRVYALTFWAESFEHFGIYHAASFTSGFDISRRRQLLGWEIRPDIADRFMYI